MASTCKSMVAEILMITNLELYTQKMVSKSPSFLNSQNSHSMTILYYNSHNNAVVTVTQSQLFIQIN